QTDTLLPPYPRTLSPPSRRRRPTALPPPPPHRPPAAATPPTVFPTTARRFPFTGDDFLKLLQLPPPLFQGSHRTAPSQGSHRPPPPQGSRRPPPSHLRGVNRAGEPPFPNPNPRKDISGCGKFRKQPLQNEDELAICFGDIINIGIDHWSPCGANLQTPQVIDDSPEEAHGAGDEAQGLGDETQEDNVETPTSGKRTARPVVEEKNKKDTHLFVILLSAHLGHIK
ncbi:unnamed protein product, partial [Urochloa humidicola]